MTKSLQILKVDPPLQEIGTSGLNRSGGQIAEEPLHRLRGEMGRRIYNEMRLNDDAVGALLFSITMLLRGVEWIGEPASDDSVDLERAEYLESLMDDMSHSWPSFISEVLTLLPFGWSYFETVFKRRQGEKKRPGESSKFSDGLVGIRKLALRGQDTLEKWLFDDEGGIQAMKQRGISTPIPIEKSLLFRHHHEKNNPEGLSLLRVAWRSWYFKKKLQGFEAVGVERDATGYPIAKVASSIFNSKKPADVTLMAEIRDIVTNFRRDELEGAVFPLAFDADGNPMFVFELLKSGGDRQFDIGPIIARYDRAILRAGLADFLLFGGGDSSGNRSLGETRSVLFQKALNATLDEIESVLNRHLIPRLMRLNGWTGESPRFRHVPVETIDIESVSKMIQNLMMAGADILPNDDIENALLESAGLPLKPETDADESVELELE